MPPKEKRGLVLVDPPFEVEGEWERLVEGLAKAHRKWASGLYLLWYPLKEPREVNRFVAALKATGIRRMLRAELTVMPAVAGRLHGSGLIVVNPPFTLEAELNIILPALARVLDPDVRWTVHSSRGVLVRHGAAEVAERARLGGRTSGVASRALVDGEPGIVVRAPNGRLVGVMACTVAGGRIVEIRSVSDPARLATIDRPGGRNG